MNRGVVRTLLRILLLILLAAAAATGAVALAMQFRIRIANDWQQNAPLTPVSTHSKQDRIVVFAPHSDDETLGCGGMLSLAAANGAHVRVVLVTNGDGFRIAVGKAYRTVRVTPQKCIKFAYRRQQETLRALKVLGIEPSAVTFLGYPDRGIASLWERHWERDNLYTSRATGHDRSPFENSYTPHAPYCGESLLADIVSILKAETPTYVYVPHPSDNHSDHYATYCFVMAAIEQLRSEDSAVDRRLKVRTYLVHRHDWPCPRGDRPNDPLPPPYSLARTDTRWRSLDLPEQVVQAKRAAIGCYRTQTAIERAFLMSFARKNELFGSVPPGRIQVVPSGTVTVDGSTADWAGVTPAALYPVGDYVVADISKGGDVRAVYLCRDERFLYIRVEFAGKISRQLTYSVNIKNVSERADEFLRFRVKPGSAAHPTGCDVAFGDSSLEMALPITRIENRDEIFIQIHTRLGRVTVDNTGWRGVKF